MKIRSAFTLIELLVVIAIIAILAAILFPVFAQAKAAAKKTVVISNTKQEGTAFQIYLNDSDDVYPLAFGYRPETGTWGYGVVTPTPANVVQASPWTTPGRIAMAASMWSNSVQPYTKNYGIYAYTGAPLTTTAGDTFTTGVTPAQCFLTMNGILHTIPASSIVAASNTVLLWDGAGLQNLNGRAFSNPVLTCAAGAIGVPSSCSAVASPGSAFYYFPGISNWVFGKTMPICRADTSAKSVPVGTAIDPNFVSNAGWYTDPFAEVSSTGIVESYWAATDANCSLGGTGVLPCYFRPDRTN